MNIFAALKLLKNAPALSHIITPTFRNPRGCRERERERERESTSLNNKKQFSSNFPLKDSGKTEVPYIIFVPRYPEIINFPKLPYGSFQNITAPVFEQALQKTTDFCGLTQSPYCYTYTAREGTGESGNRSACVFFTGDYSNTNSYFPVLYVEIPGLKRVFPVSRKMIPGDPGMIPSDPGINLASMGMPPRSMGTIPGLTGMLPTSMGMIPASMGLSPGLAGMQPGFRGTATFKEGNLLQTAIKQHENLTIK